MVPNMKDNTRKVCNLEQEYYIFQMELDIKVVINMVYRMGKVLSIMVMVKSMKVNGKMVKNQEKVYNYFLMEINM